jgi:polar amino acid transport system substrate-binding protein
MAGLFDARVDLTRVIKIAPIVESPVLIVGKAGMKPISSIEELRGKVVGHMRGSKYGPVFDEATHFTKTPINTMSQGLAMLYRGRIDAMAGVDLTFYWAIKEKRFAPSDFVPLLVISKPVASLYMSKTSPHQDLIPRYRKAMQYLHDTGVIDEIFGHSTDWDQMDGWSAPWVPKKPVLPEPNSVGSPILPVQKHLRALEPSGLVNGER